MTLSLRSQEESRLRGSKAAREPSGKPALWPILSTSVSQSLERDRQTQSMSVSHYLWSGGVREKWGPGDQALSIVPGKQAAMAGTGCEEERSMGGGYIDDGTLTCHRDETWQK